MIGLPTPASWFCAGRLPGQKWKWVEGIKLGIPSRHHGCFNGKRTNDLDDLGVPPFRNPPFDTMSCDLHPPAFVSFPRLIVVFCRISTRSERYHLSNTRIPYASHATPTKFQTFQGADVFWANPRRLDRSPPQNDALAAQGVLRNCGRIQPGAWNWNWSLFSSWQI